MVCLTGGCKNTIFCGGCITLGGSLSPDIELRRNPCLGGAQPIDGRPFKEVLIGDEKLEVSPEFCYLCDILCWGPLSAGFSHRLQVSLRQLLPFLTNHELLLLTQGGVYSTCVRIVMMCPSETRAMTTDTMNPLLHNNHAMIHWIPNIKAKDENSSDSLLIKLCFRCG